MKKTQLLALFGDYVDALLEVNRIALNEPPTITTEQLKEVAVAKMERLKGHVLSVINDPSVLAVKN